MLNNLKPRGVFADVHLSGECLFCLRCISRFWVFVILKVSGKYVDLQVVD